jgi:hypothetical protein
MTLDTQVAAKRIIVAKVLSEQAEREGCVFAAPRTAHGELVRVPHPDFVARSDA